MEDLGSIPELGRSPGGRHGNPLQYSCLENPQGQRSLVGYRPWGHKKSDTAEQLRHTQFSRSVRLSATPWTAARQAPLSITNSWSSLKLMSIESVMLSNHLILCRPLLLLPSIFPSIKVFFSESVLRIRCQSTGDSASKSVLPMNIQDWFPLGWTGWISLQSKGLSSVFSTPLLKSINSSRLSFLYSPTLTSIHDHCKSHSFACTDLCHKCLCFLICCVGWSYLLFQRAFFYFMAAIAICSEFGAQENKVCHCFHCFFIYLPHTNLFAKTHTHSIQKVFYLPDPRMHIPITLTQHWY